MHDKSSSVLGVDVSKDWLDVAIAGQPGSARLANTSAAMDAFLAAHPDIAMVAFEPTGGYERVLVGVLRARAILAFRIHPNQVIAFRKASGIKAKTDRIDARLIAQFVCHQIERSSAPVILPGDACTDLLGDLIARRRQIVQMLNAERCRLKIAPPGPVSDSLHTLIATLVSALDVIEAELQAAIAKTPRLHHQAQLLTSFKGVGPITATTLIADLPELGLISDKQIASLVGLAPTTRQSGKSTKYARTGHGRPDVRRVLFNAARSAIRHNPVMADFYKRLVTQNQRPGKVALIAVMRKILVILNAMTRTNSNWKYAST